MREGGRQTIDRDEVEAEVGVMHTIGKGTQKTVLSSSLVIRDRLALAGTGPDASADSPRDAHTETGSSSYDE